MHAVRKAQLEVTFEGEEGHGSGVTNEFYSLVSEGLQRRYETTCVCVYIYIYTYVYIYICVYSV
jgi:hypothetical protein